MKKSNIIAICVCVAVAIVIVMIFLFADKPIDGPNLINGFTDKDDDKVMLVEYTSKRTGTYNNDGYQKTVLYQNKDGSCEVHFYAMNVGDEKEAHSAYRVEKQIISEVYKIINDNKLVKWNKKYKDFGLDGGYYSVRFRNSDGTYVTVDSDRMPDDGQRIMGSIDVKIRSMTYTKDEIK